MDSKLKPTIPRELACSESDSDSDSEDSDENVDELCTFDNDEPTVNEHLPIKAMCLFCKHEDVSGYNLVSDHFQQVHQLNLTDWILKFHMGNLQYIKMINYFRKMNGNFVSSEIIKSINSGAGSPPWRSDEFLTPLALNDGDDPLLCLNFDEFVESDDDKDLEVVGVSADDDGHSECNRVINMLRDVVQKVVGDEKTAESNSLPVASKSDDLTDDNSGYFNSYDDVDIHATMLNDIPRTAAYMQAIEKGSVCLGKSVLDVGCGTGILSMFAARAGAAYVCAIDRSDIIFDTIDIIHENKLQDIIECIHGSVETLRREKFDVIVSEWMGYFLLFEGMLSSFLVARDNLLKPGGTLIPSQARMYIAGVSCLDFRDSWVGKWDCQYGFKMSSMKRRAINQPQIVTVCSEDVITNSFEILNLDLYHCSEKDAIIMQNFELTSNSSRLLTGIAGFFDVTLNNLSSLPQIILDTGPSALPSHWKQCLFQVPETIPLEKGQIITGRIECKPNRANERYLDVSIKLNEPKLRLNYVLN